MRILLAPLFVALGLTLAACPAATLGLIAASTAFTAVEKADDMGLFGPAGIAVDVGAEIREGLCNPDTEIGIRLRDRIRSAATSRGVTVDELRAALCP